LSGTGLCDELITRPEESYRLCCVVVCDLETSRMGAPYIYDISHLRVNICMETRLKLDKEHWYEYVLKLVETSHEAKETILGINKCKLTQPSLTTNYTS